MDEQKQKLVERIRQAQNILVTVSANPTVDQLAAAIGLTLALNKLGKHGTAVFSGQVPNTLEFLKPAETLEKNTDSLRDFIIALDKAKADKLRYKVENDVVRIFITPYKTSLSQSDLDFSQGDFNVDVVVAIGVTDPADLDTAITSHGRILHDAAVASLSTTGQGSLGTINWVDPGASCLSEMVVNLVDGLDKKVIDEQIATSLLTGIVASTERFSNDKTSPKTMSASAALMAAGANQQLIATQLENPTEIVEQPDVTDAKTDNSVAPPAADTPKAEAGTLEIAHQDTAQSDSSEPGPADTSADETASDAEADSEKPSPQVQVDYEGQLQTVGDTELPTISRVRGTGSDGRSTDSGSQSSNPPATGDSTQPSSNASEELDSDTEELSLPAMDSPLLTHNENLLPPASVPHLSTDSSTPQQSLQPAPPSWQAPGPATTLSDVPTSSSPFQPSTSVPSNPSPDPITPDTTLSQIEQSLGSPHATTGAIPSASSTSHVEDARSAVEAALNHSTAADPLQPIAALNAQPLGPELRDDAPAIPPFTPPPARVAATAFPNAGFSEPTPGNTPADDALDMPLPSNPFGPGKSASTEQFQLPQSFAPPAPFTPAPSASPSAFPGIPQQANGQAPPPPVPPPMLPPLQ